jgi:O-antigen ligase
MPPLSVRMEGFQLHREMILETDVGPRVNQLIRWTFYLFLITIPFESVGFFRSEENSFTISRIIGFALAAISLMQPGVCFAKPPLPFWLFSIYLAVTCTLGLFGNPLYLIPVRVYLSTLSQNLFLFWLAANILRDRRVVTGTLLATGISCTVLSIVMTLGIGTREIVTVDGKRLSLAEADPNGLAFVLIIGLLSLVGFAYVRSRRLRTWNFLLFPCYILLVQMIVLSGSRSAIVSAAVGVGVLMMNSGGTGKVKTAIALGILLAIMGWKVVGSEMLMSRWERELTSGGLGQRQSISLSALSMIADSPLVGWGPINHLAELSNREGYSMPYRDTHNDLLWAFTSTGLIGGLPFLIAAGYCLYYAWRAKQGPENILPLALMVVMCVMSLSVTLHQRKLAWILMGYAVASGCTAIKAARAPKSPLITSSSLKS